MSRLRRLVATIGITTIAVAGTGIVYLAQTSEPPSVDSSLDQPGPSAAPSLTPAPPAPSLPAQPPSAPPATVAAHVLAIGQSGLPRAALQKVDELKGVKKTTSADGGTVPMGARRLTLLAVEPESFRAWTPEATAKEPRLWDALEGGDLVVDIETAQEFTMRAGGFYQVGTVPQLRVGALATLGLPGVDGVVNRTVGRKLGLEPDVAVLVNAPKAEHRPLAKGMRKQLGKELQVIDLRPPGQKRSNPKGKVRSYIDLYRRSAGVCPGLPWTVLAAIGQVESGHGRNNGPSSAGALGPMQFLPSTWKSYGVDGDGDGRADIMNPFDAVPSAAKYLCASGGAKDLRRAVYAYNHSWSYVDKVLALAQAYGKAYS